ncbi:PQ-loop-domain-containing protein [Russula earlei]|uniref:PQ-loop-domain-containing protein n=1 Tax=Russula earlei TaxID=71964 RepID=A0ACC0UBL6_9AGAM|nr:PQ-loop-domain-containing protein [Russula earlei]
MTRFTDALSGILGWISIATWVVVYSPQIYENFVLKSGEGLSIAFVVIWLAGDLCNLLGASMAGLLPTVIILAAYYTFCDTVLLIQIYYYRWMNTGTLARPEVQGVGDAEEATPLLTSNNNDGQVTEKGRSLKRHVLEYVGMINCLVVAGIVAWAISEKVQGIDEPRPGAIVEWRSQMMGYASALLYVGSRVPQISKNFETKCDGLSPGLFIFGIMGNLTYALSIWVSSGEMGHLIANASWLAGSTVTMILDIFVLGQFLYYRRKGG